MLAYKPCQGKGTKTDIPMGPYGNAFHVDENGDGAMAKPFIYDASMSTNFSSVFLVAI